MYLTYVLVGGWVGGGGGVALKKELKCVRVVSCGVNFVHIALTETR